MKTLIKNIGLIATPFGTSAKKGAMQGEIKYYKNAYILIENEKIKSISEDTNYPDADLVIDANNKLITPGFIDPHTHLVFGGWRQNELQMKLKNVPYLEILQKGGGILSTVNATRESTLEELKQKASKVLKRMIKFGVTTCEAKSGYGLDLQNEKKMLYVIKELKQEEDIELVSTFMGAHALPNEYKNNRQAYIDLVINEMIPMVVNENLAEFIDAFCEKGVFTKEESKVILEAGKRKGLIPKCHTDEIEPIGGTEMAANIGAISCEHLIKANEEGIKAMAKSGTIACLLPATSFYLNSTYAPARQMINENVAIAFGSDFNPGSCPCNNYTLAMNIACLKYRMTKEECLTATTLNAAACINRAKTLGTIEIDKQADLIFWDANDLEYIYYRFGDNLVDKVMKKGKIVVEN
ncbi:MAG: imidazolonepropionase [Eubacteriales bacterium]|nr:imidazolonepropionase [Eubacteriales bacterium]